MIFHENDAALLQLSKLSDNKQFQNALLSLRTLIVSTAKDLKLSELNETLKWGQPSYECIQGSALRIGLAKKPNSMALFFHCQSKLGETFKELYKNELEFEGKRAIVLPCDKPLSQAQKNALQHCISLALQYHSVKHLPLLGG